GPVGGPAGRPRRRAGDGPPAAAAVQDPRPVQPDVPDRQADRAPGEGALRMAAGPDGAGGAVVAEGPRGGRALPDAVRAGAVACRTRRAPPAGRRGGRDPPRPRARAVYANRGRRRSAPTGRRRSAVAIDSPSERR